MTMLNRVHWIQQRKASLGSVIQVFTPDDISGQIHQEFQLRLRESWKRRIGRQVAADVLRLLQSRNRAIIGTGLPFHCDLVCIGERFGSDASRAVLLRELGGERIRRVAIPGCYLASEDVQFWLRRGVESLDGFDVYSLETRWRAILPILRSHFGANVSFRQANIEALPYPDQSIDLIASSAVLEHVRNLSAMARETARVLRDGGWASHDFGPLYFSYGGDHCIAAYGDVAGYDHLLLPEVEYQELIQDQAYFDRQNDPNLPFWARNEQFAFATAEDYLHAFAVSFEIRHVVAKVCEKGLAFRERYPAKWRQLLEAGIPESALLVKSLGVVLKKKATAHPTNTDEIMGQHASTGA